MAREITKGQMREILRQLSAGEVDHERAQAFITKRTPAETAAATTLRELQAHRLWGFKFGDVLGCSTFEQYLDGVGRDSLEPIPEVPVFPREQIRLFGPQGNFLVDGRVEEKIGLVECAKLVGLAYDGDDETFAPFSSNQKQSGVRWMIAQDGFRNQGLLPDACQKDFVSFEIGGDVTEGIGIWLQDSEVVVGHYMDLPGSVSRADRDYVAYLGLFWRDSTPQLGWRWGIIDDYAFRDHGSVSRGKKILSA